MPRLRALVGRWFALPTLASEEQTQAARIFHRVAWMNIGVIATAMTLLALNEPASLLRRTMTVVVVMVASFLLLELSARGRTPLASWLFVGVLLVLIAQRALTSGGLTAPATAGLVVMVLIGGVLLGSRGGSIVALLSAGIGYGLLQLDRAGALPPPEVHFGLLAHWLMSCLWLGMAVVLQVQVAASLKEALRRTTEELHERREAQQDLKERVKELALLHTAARLLHPQRPADRALLQELVDLIPDAWQFPECCEARIDYRDVAVATAGWRDSPWRQSTRFETTDGSGVIEVVYLEERPPAAIGPFLEEEQTLLASVADMLVGFLELRKHQEHLQALVERRTEELRTATEEADRANRAKGAFLANMSHEIRTPLNAVLGYAQLLRRDGSLGDEQRRKVGVILASGDHLLALINNVLEMSKIEAGRVTLAEDPVDLHALLDGTRHMLAGLARTRGLELVFEVSAGLPRAVSGDAAKIRQVVINLVSNALKFTQKGRVTLRASAQPGGTQGHAVKILVEDTGAGIEPGDLVRVFEAFEQTHVGKGAGGSGLGLPISREFARLMGGDLTVDSQPGKGSTFAFSFQARVVAAAPPARPERPLPVGLAAGQAPRKVLIVDDVATNRELLVELLGSMGFKTRVAASGEEALDVHALWQPDLVLMDLRMPGIDGLEAIRRMRAAGSRAVIIANSASSVADMDEEARRAGADHFVRKPYVEAELLEKIGAALGLSYTYGAVDGVVPPRASDIGAAAASLSALVPGLPADLVHELRQAALEARARRIDELADRVGTHSEAAAAHVRALAEGFRYEALLGALQPGGLA